tara:strand:+ start:47731 stop:48306 length:576 start_codon:yes stop_codon:yes gene_type:complete
MPKPMLEARNAPLPSAARIQELLLDAARIGRTDMVAPLLAAGADVDGRDRHGYTALILAAYHGHLETAVELLDRGAAVDAVDDKRGNTALMGIAFKGYDEIAEELIDAGADVNLRNNAGQTALMMASLVGHARIASLLMRAGANPTLRDVAGNCARSVAAAQGNSEMTLLLAGPVPAAMSNISNPQVVALQ